MDLAGLIATVAVLGVPQQDPAARAFELAQSGRFVEALEVAAHVDEGGLAARIEADVRWRAGDLGGALSAVREGIAASPDDPLLRQLGARLALQLQRTEQAEGHLEALRRSVAAPTFQGTLDAAGRSWWDDEIASLAAETQSSRDALRARDRAVSSARVVVWIAALGGLLAALGLARRPSASR